GTAALLWVATHRHTDGMARERAEALAEVATPDEIGRVVALLMPGEVGDLKAPGTGDGEGMPYTRLRAVLCKHYGWTHADVDDMDFENIRAAWNGMAEDDGGSVGASA